MKTPEVILGNSSRRFSGVTSTMLATLPGVMEQMEVAVLGVHHLPSGVRSLTYWEFVKLCRNPLAGGRDRLFHARRNDEMIQALVAKWLFGAKIKIVFTSTAQRHHSRFTKFLIRQMDGVLSTCQAAAFYLDQEPDRLIPHGVSLEEFAPPENRAAHWKSLGHGGEYGIGIFGRVRPQKGIDLLVRAAIPLLKDDPKPSIVIIGETTPKFAEFQSQLQQEINDAGLSERILFLGKLPFAEVKKYYQGVSLVAALSRNEGFGLTVLEAMASGCAVLASEAGAWKEIVREGVDGEIVPVGDEDAVSEKLSLLIKDPNQLLDLGRCGREGVCECYSLARETSGLVSYYQAQLH